MDLVHQIRLENEEDITTLHSILGGHVFRGHASTKWKLASTLERICESHNVGSSSIIERETNSLLEFQRRAHHYIQDPPDNDNFLEWASLLQHYGGPTRLVDVTHSLFVAAFFAIENATDDAAVWAFNTGKITLRSEPEGPRSPASNAIIEANAILRGELEKSGLRLVKPFRLNERLANQQGAFIMPLSVTESFESQMAAQLDIDVDNIRTVNNVHESKLRTTLGHSTAVKIIIPREIQSRLIRLLDAANVNAATLFAGLEGFARSLKAGFRIFE